MKNSRSTIYGIIRYTRYEYYTIEHAFSESSRGQSVVVSLLKQNVVVWIHFSNSSTEVKHWTSNKGLLPPTPFYAYNRSCDLSYCISECFSVCLL